MREYTLLTVTTVVAAILLDRWSGVRLLRRREFHALLAFVFVMMVLVNGYLTGMMGDAIVLYEPWSFLGLRLATIPLEDFGFGFGMIVLSTVTWEWLGQRREAKRSSSEQS